MASIFTKIINSEIPSYKIAEDENYYAFLDINPIAKAHTLVVPKKEVDYIFDIDDDTLGGLIIFAKRVSKAIEKSVDCKRIGVVVLGLEVPHAHIHLVPLNSESDVDFKKPKLQLSAEEFKEIAENIRKNL
jgi:histidine triad (HIT) family protein